jgi:hypothetical protein
MIDMHHRRANAEFGGGYGSEILQKLLVDVYDGAVQHDAHKADFLKSLKADLESKPRSKGVGNCNRILLFKKIAKTLDIWNFTQTRSQ